MHITRYTDYSLRVLLYLAVNNKELATIKVIADSYGISKNHLMKIVQHLSAKGHVEAVRGKNGGLRLAAKPEQINIGKLVRDMEQGSPLVECFGTDNECVITPACQLKHVLAEAMESFFQTLDQYSLADMLLPKHMKGLEQILRLE
ncbi:MULTISPECIES: RrF2 family transcriptional regulator [Kordiimonas]|uniref:Transcriptional regulator, BadM/Rrf2 family n=1 Tax=Kordiimonas lacus TaxID=637679 RepID=A0A1G6YQ92_9PROT|nr:MULTISPECIES: Rrf2 family transcriptional regulator [Kordiimonas]SDD91716.1 transcriptional regulator, BadM/Rrf2 family [Kordiimonas lacus]